MCPKQASSVGLCQFAKTFLNGLRDGKMLPTEVKKKALFLNLLFFPYSCNMSLKSLDWIGQNPSFRISAYDGFRI